MPSLMLKLMACVIGLAIAVAAAAPADAAKARKHKTSAARAAKVVKVQSRGQDLFPPGPVYFAGEYLGDDPDPNIRFQLLRDLGAHFGGED